MSHDDMLIRAGYYIGLAWRLLCDDTYARRYLGKAETLTEAGYMELTAEIQHRLHAAGFIAADEDPWESDIR